MTRSAKVQALHRRIRPELQPFDSFAALLRAPSDAIGAWENGDLRRETNGFVWQWDVNYMVNSGLWYVYIYIYLYIYVCVRITPEGPGIEFFQSWGRFNPDWNGFVIDFFQ